MEALVYLDGQILSEKEAKISVFDLGILRGYGVFDFLRTYQKYPFHLWDHLERFEASAKDFDLPMPLSTGEIAAIIEELLQKVSFPEADVKMFLTGGISSSQYLPQNAPTFFVMVYPLTRFPEEIYRQGISLVTEVYERSYPYCKSLHYIPAIMGTRRAQKKGADEVLFLNRQREILEASRANFFAIKGDTVVTAGKGIVLGITRQIILDFLQKRGISIEVRAMDMKEIPFCGGAFITSSSGGVIPVVKIDETPLPLHPLITTIMRDFSAYTRAIPNPFLRRSKSINLTTK